MCYLVRPRSYEKTVLAVLLSKLIAHKLVSTANTEGWSMISKGSPQSFQFALTCMQNSSFYKCNLAILGQIFS